MYELTDDNYELRYKLLQSKLKIGLFGKIQTGFPVWVGIGTDARQPWNLDVNQYSIVSVHHADGVMMVSAHKGLQHRAGTVSC